MPWKEPETGASPVLPTHYPAFSRNREVSLPELLLKSKEGTDNLTILKPAPETKLVFSALHKAKRVGVARETDYEM
jgi:hypothetical protein